jgi:uncharacterized membrane protein HdeD (DUF308 family)
MLQKIKKIASNLWWLLVVSSIASIIFGTVALLMPGLTIALLVEMFAGLILIIGIVQIIHGFAFVGMDKSVWITLSLGILLSAMGTYLILHPVISIVAFVVVATWILLVDGIMKIIIGMLSLNHKASWIFSGILGIIAGIVIFIYPGAGTLAFVWVLGAYALINGIIMLSRAIAVRIAYREITNGMQ